MNNTTGSRKMLNQHRFRPHLINSRIINTSQPPIVHHLETNSPQLIGLKVKIFNSSASSSQIEDGAKTKESVMSRLDMGDGEDEHRPKDSQDFRFVDEGYCTPSTGTSSPALRSSKSEVLVDECYPESPPELQLHDKVKCGTQFSFVEDDLCSTQSGLPSQPVNIVECLEVDADGGWNIGHPMFESSTNHSFVNLNETNEQNAVESNAQKDVREPLSNSSADSGVNTSWESTILPHVQVQSKVVVPDQVQAKPVYSSPRSINFKEAYWKQKKDQYVNLVSRHYMFENPRTDHDAMSDLVDLMSHVDKRSTDSHGRNWQHPSDLTLRNYSARFGNDDVKLSLQEWQDKNGKTHKRFANIPKIFQRSPC